jgi:hypothetical protein
MLRLIQTFIISPRNIMKFHSARRSTMRFAILAAFVSATLGLVAVTMTISTATTWRDVADEIARIFSPGSPHRKDAGSKGADSIISPGVWVDAAAKSGAIDEVWNIRPAILYESSGNADNDPDRIKVNQDETVIQSFDLKDAPRYRKLSIETALKPGQKYQIFQFLGKSDTPTGAPTEFIVMPDGPKRQAIAEKLAKVDCEFSKDEAKRTIGRIQVFVKARLWSDALQEASTLVRNDQEWENLKAGTIDKWEKLKR